MSILPHESLAESTALPAQRGVLLKLLRLDGNTQCRAALDADHIDSLVEVLEGGQSLPAAVVYLDGSNYWLADGFHRYHAAQKRGASELWCEVRSGTRLDAVRHAIGANATHGLHRSNADKRRAVEIALKEFPTLSSRALAHECGVSHQFVQNLRPAPLPDELREGADGKEYAASNSRFPEANRAPGDPAPLPDNFLADTPSGGGAQGPTVEEIAAELAREDRAAKLPELISRARVAISQIRAIGKKEVSWLLAHYLADADWACPRSIRADAAKRQEVRLPREVVDLDNAWHASLGLATLGNLDHVAVIRTLLDMRLVRAGEVIFSRGSECEAGDFLRYVLDQDLLGLDEETPLGKRQLTARAEQQLRTAAKSAVAAS